MADSLKMADIPTFAGSPTVCIVVGCDKTKYILHKSLICHYSSYSKGAFEGRFQEAETKNLNLEEDEPEIFEMFARALYSGLLLTSIHLDSTKCFDLLKLWILADKLLVPKLKNHIINLIFKNEMYHSSFDLKPHYHWIWEHTSDDSKLRSFLVARYAFLYNLDEAFDDADDSAFPMSMLIEVIERLKSGMRSRVPIKQKWFDLDLCQYHDHPPGIRC